MSYTSAYKSPIGLITLASDGESITGLWFEGQKYYAATLESEHKAAALPIFEQARHWLDIYFSGKEPDFQLPLSPKGSEFRQEVWTLLLDIPYGKTATYGELAKKLEAQLGRKTSARAVG